MINSILPAPLAAFDFDKFSDSGHMDTKCVSSSTNLLKKSTSEPCDLDFASPLNFSLQNLVENFEKEVCLLGNNIPLSSISYLNINGAWKIPSLQRNSLFDKAVNPQMDEEGSIRMADEDASSVTSDTSTDHTCSSCGRREMPDDLDDELSSDEHIPTADDVITEIDQIMSMSNSVGFLNSSYASYEDLRIVQMELRHFKENLPSIELSENKMEYHLQHLSIECLRYYSHELQNDIETLNNDLLHELRVRDDCECLREIMEEFISLMNGVQRIKRELVLKRQKELTAGSGYHNNEKSRKRWSWAGLRLPSSDHNKSMANMSNKNMKPASSRKFIGLMIPYHASSLRLDMPQLLMFNKLLKAILSDDSAITELLTEYILKDYLPSSLNGSECCMKSTHDVDLDDAADNEVMPQNTFQNEPPPPPLIY